MLDPFVGVEIAIRAFGLAERDVDVEAQSPGHCVPALAGAGSRTYLDSIRH